MKRIKQEIYILIGIILIITALEIVTNCISNKSVEKILGQLNNLKAELDKIESQDESEEVKEVLAEMNELNQNTIKVEEKENTIKQNMKNLKEDWFREETKLSFFSEHDELEKISYAMVILEENINNEEYEESLSNIIEAEFWLEHVKDKDSFKLKNIF